ncbi:DUF1934 domain-containing protein [Marinicrinis sediminis]|uniref:DUF1934 domain-containing protein n=1 Tax=Marinicrinis sediminis TaxID=1652465 RepID=A0ABW5RFD4_9BACL
MKAEPASIQLHIESRQGEESVRQQLQGTRFQKASALYLRYEESDPAMGQTMTTIKINETQIKVIRHGDIESEQVFEEQQSHSGYYQFAHGKLLLRTENVQIRNELNEGKGSVAWSYDLYSEEQHVGHVDIQIHIQEDSQT